MPGNHNASEKEEIWDRLIHSRTNDKRLSGLVKFQPVHLVKIQPVRTAWRAVGLTAPREWFYVSYTLSTPKGNLAETALIANPAGELLEFLDQEDEGISALSVQLVTPPFLNGSERWKMEPLIRVWKKPSDPLAHVYEVEGGQRYCTAYGAWDISEYEFWKELRS